MRRAVPSLFVSHGAPTFALEPGLAGRHLARVASRIGRPTAILVISAHWDTDTPSVSATPRPDTIHDFFGFPEPLYDLRYACPGAPPLAARARELLAEAGFAARTDATRGLDHGAWVPLMHLFPDADIPVAQLSVQSRLGPAHHWAVGRALAALRDEGVLMIGSGSITHNLREFRMAPEDADEAPYVHEFRAWMADRIAARDHDALLHYRTTAPHAVRAHPTEEHLLPLFVALGAAATDDTNERIHSGVTYGVIGMDTYLFGTAERDGERAA